MGRTSIEGFAHIGALEDFNVPLVERSQKRFATIAPIGVNRAGLDMIAHGYFEVTALDTVEANSTAIQINATGHTARPGDIIRFITTANTILQRDVPVKAVTANSITLDGRLDATLTTGDTFAIYRPTAQRLGADGSISVTYTPAPIQFVLDGVNTDVTEDTVTPANNRPLPVKITGLTGDINITAGDLNVQLSHAGVSFDSVRLGDGTDLAEITAAGELLTQPAGNVAANAADSGNPIKMGGVYNLALPTLDDGDRGNLQLDSNGRLLVAFAATSLVAANAADTENPQKVGARYDLALPTYDDGDKTNLQADANGRLWTTFRGIQQEDVASADGDYGLGVLLKRQDTLVSDTDTNGDYIASKATALGELYVANLRLEALLPTSLGQKASAASFATVLSTEQETILTDIRTSVQLLDNAVAGNEFQVDLVDINGIATEANQVLMLADLADIEAAVEAITLQLPSVIGQNLAADSLSVVLASDATLPASAGRTVVTTVRHDYVAVPVTTGTPDEIIAAIPADVNEIEIFDSSGQTMELRVGAVAGTHLLYVFPGGNGRIPVTLPSGTRLLVQAISATASVGELTINLYA